MRYIKQIDEHQRNLTALTAKTMELISFTNDLFDYEIATLQSQIIQEKKKRKNVRTFKPK